MLLDWLNADIYLFIYDSTFNVKRKCEKDV